MAGRDDIPYFSGPRADKPRRPESEDSATTPSPVEPDAGSAATPASDAEASLAAQTGPEVDTAGIPESDADAIPASTPERDAEATALPTQVSSAGSRGRRDARIVAIAVVCLGLVFLGVWFTLNALRQVSTPFIIARTPSAAERILNNSGLVAGTARLLATGEFAPGLVMEQSPRASTKLRLGSSVNVVVATGTVNAIVPDVFLVDQQAAEAFLRGSLFIPISIKVYSAQAPIGSVVSQLPRAGDYAFTGSPIYLAISMGPGTPGVVVPNLVHKPYRVAASLLTTESIFPRTLAVDAPGFATDTVVDQMPASGTVVPVGTSVAVSVASPAQ